MQQNKKPEKTEKIYILCFACVQRCCATFVTRTLDSRVHRLYSEKTVWIIQSVKEYSQSSFNAILFQTAVKSVVWVTFLVPWNGAYCTKTVILAFKSLSQDADSLEPQKIKKATKFIRPVVAIKVLDTLSTIQNMTFSSLRHANIIMPSAIWLELSNLRVTLSDVTKMSLRTPYPLNTCTWIKAWAQVYFQMSYTVPIVSAFELFPQFPSETSLHICLHSNWSI